MTRSILRIGSLVVVLLLAASCGGTDDPLGGTDDREIGIIRFDQASVQLSVGDTLRLAPEFDTPEGFQVERDEAVSYSSSAPAVASVVAKGEKYELVITALSPGTATITATCCGSIQTTIAVTVTGVTSWVLDSVSGGSTLNLTQSGGTLNATIVFNPPAQVSVGENAVSATINATVTSNPPPIPPPALDWIVGARVSDVTVDASAAPLATANTHLNANPTATETITATGTWTIPSSYQSRQTLRLRAFGVAPIGTFPNRDAYYHKVGQ